MSETPPRIGSLFTGTAALDMAVEAVFGGHTVWHCDNDPAATALLAHHYPGVPNLGDITQVDWQQVAADMPVDVLTGGFPCQDVSCAGPRTGLLPGNRSGLWAHMRRAIYAIQPRMVVIENVRNLASATAHRDVEPEETLLGDRGAEPVLRALGAVLGDLAELGFDAEWRGLRAADVGAPHSRYRVFIVATDTQGDGRHERRPQPSRVVGRPDVALRGHEFGQIESGAIDADSSEGRPTQELQNMRHSADAEAIRQTSRGSRGLPAPELLFTDLREHSSNSRQGHAPLASQEAPQTHVREVRDDAGPACSPQGPEPGEQRTNQSGNAVLGLSSSPALAGGPCEENGKPQAWGPYEQAIKRWECVLGRSAPSPTQTGERGAPVLSPAFCEWLMGLDAGWVTAVPGLDKRNDQLRLIGNGVVPQQATAALIDMTSEMNQEAHALDTTTSGNHPGPQ